MNATCSDLGVGFNCSCNSGYSGNGSHCESQYFCLNFNLVVNPTSMADIDECEVGTNACDKDHADCIDTEGSYSCLCHIGYSGNGELCCMSL